MLAGTKFKRLIPDQGPAAEDPARVKRVIFCTGKVYYELARERKQGNLEQDVAIIRLEQVQRSHHGESLTTSPCVVHSSHPPSLLRSHRSRSTWSDWRRRGTPTQSWCGARRSTRTWATTTMCDRVSSRWWRTGGPFGELGHFVHTHPQPKYKPP